MTLLKTKFILAREILKQIKISEPEHHCRLTDLDWFGIEITWASDEALFEGDLRAEIWNECCVKDHSKRLILAPFRIRLDDNDTISDIADTIEREWDRTVGLREFDLDL